MIYLLGNFSTVYVHRLFLVLPGEEAVSVHSKLPEQCGPRPKSFWSCKMCSTQREESLAICPIPGKKVLNNVFLSGLGWLSPTFLKLDIKLDKYKGFH